MSERIFVSSLNLPSSPDRFSGKAYDEQENSIVDARYVGIEVKKRLHPRLIIKKFRTIQGSPFTGLNEIQFDNFILETAAESVEEKYQIIQTFGPDFLFLFGPRPRVFSYSGRLFNTEDKPWKDELQAAWDRSIPVIDSYPTDEKHEDKQRGILSGTNVILTGGITRLEYDNGSFAISREGYLLKFTTALTSNSQNSCPFSMDLFITSKF